MAAIVLSGGLRLEGQVTFLHGADLHLGSPLSSVGRMSAELREKIREAGYTAFRRMIDAALRHKVEFVVLCGDIYDQTERSARAKGFFIEQMDRLKHAAIPVYLIYGNHDPLGKRPAYFKYPDNVHILAAAEVDIMEVVGKDGRIKARILGQSYNQPWEKGKMHQSYTPPDHNVVNIALLHTGLNPSTMNYVPCSAAELKNISGFDYWALGHIHQRQVVHSQYPVIAFPGSPQGRHMGEPGLGGCLLVTAQRGKAATLQFIPTSSIVWLARDVPVKESDRSEDDLIASMIETGDQLLAAAAAMSGPEMDLAPGEAIDIEGFIVRWKFSGRGEIHNIIANDDEIAPELVERMRRELGGGSPFLWTEDVRFETASPLVDLENISAEDVVLGTLLQTYQEFADDPAMREQVIKLIGKSWFEQHDGEDVRDKTLPLNDAAYNSLLRRALHLAVERILEGRAL